MPCTFHISKIYNEFMYLCGHIFSHTLAHTQILFFFFRELLVNYLLAYHEVEPTTLNQLISLADNYIN